MKLVNIEYPETGVCKLTLSATAEELEAGSQAAYERTRDTYTIKGFAKGEADRAQIEADRGEHTFWYDAVNDIMDRDVPAILEQVIADEKLEVEGEPAYDLVSVKKDEGFVATAMLALTPHLTVTQYTGFTVQCVPAPTTDKEVDSAIERRRAARAELVPHKGPAVKGNTVHLSYTGFLNGKPFAGGKADNQAIELGSGRMIPGFEDQILGHKAGDEFEINVVFPANYSDRALAGKPAVFQAKLEDACVRQIPALNAELAKKLDPTCETVEDLRAAVRKQLETNKHNAAMGRARSELLTQLAAHTEGDVSSLLVDREYSAQLQQLQMSLQMQRVSMDLFLKQIHQTREEFSARMRQSADRQVRLNAALMTVAEREHLVPTDEELDAEIATRAERLKKTVEEFLQRPGQSRDTIRTTMARQRASQFVMEHSTIEE